MKDKLLNITTFVIAFLIGIVVTNRYINAPVPPDEQTSRPPAVYAEDSNALAQDTASQLDTEDKAVTQRDDKTASTTTGFSQDENDALETKLSKIPPLGLDDTQRQSQWDTQKSLQLGFK